MNISNQNEFQPNKAFVRVYGESALRESGFTMIPNDLLDNLGSLGLSSSEIVVLIVVLRVGSGFGVSARRLAKRTGLSIGKIRLSLRKLHSLGLINKSIVEPGGVNQFDIGGVIKLVKGMAHKRLRDSLNHGSPHAEITQGVTSKEGTNKEEKKMKDREKSSGYESFQNARLSLAKRRQKQ